MILLYISIILSYILLLFISKYFDPRNRKDETLENWSIYRITGFATLKIIFSAIPFLILVHFSDFSFKNSIGLLGFSLNPRIFLKGLLVAVIFFMANVIWNQFSTKISFFQKKGGQDTKKQLISKLPSHPLPLILTLLLISFQAGVLEELFFRGIIQSNISNSLFPYSGVIITAILFGMAHLYQGIRGIINTFILGLILSLSYKITGNLMIPILGHFLGNFICMMAGIPEIIRNK